MDKHLIIFIAGLASGAWLSGVQKENDALTKDNVNYKGLITELSQQAEQTRVAQETLMRVEQQKVELEQKNQDNNTQLANSSKRVSIAIRQAEACQSSRHDDQRRFDAVQVEIVGATRRAIFDLRSSIIKDQSVIERQQELIRRLTQSEG